MRVLRHDIKCYFICAKVKKCLYLTEGDLYELPLHRKWFIGATNDTIKIGKQFQIHKDGSLIYDFQFENNSWKQVVNNKFMNWAFINSFIDSFVKYPVTGRTHLAMKDGKQSFELRTGRRVYKFYLVGDNLWAVKLPKTQWLTQSNSWAILEDFNPSTTWESRHQNVLLIITNKKIDASKRKSAINNLGPTWSKAIKNAFHRVILDSNDNNQIKSLIVSKIKRKPTLENMKVLVRGLTKTENIELLRSITKVLKILNPKGPIIEPDEPEKVNEQIRSWQKWAKK